MILRLSTLAGKSRQNASKKLIQNRTSTTTRTFSSLDDRLRSHSTKPTKPSNSSSSTNSADFRSWQASHNLDIQRVTQTAMVHELTQQQTRSIEKVVPWFLETMPAPYFRQVPESFRLDHIKAISAIKDANMDMHMNLKTHLPDGRQVCCRYIYIERVIVLLFCRYFVSIGSIEIQRFMWL
mmetsp:Transcript_29017/g.54962  ORF Transcript_29017/g.54962 Transcript_29017/m.54962 type:complete len:181 (+) Transcript_29017:552-1094(+)